MEKDNIIRDLSASLQHQQSVDHTEALQEECLTLKVTYLKLYIIDTFSANPGKYIVQQYYPCYICCVEFTVFLVLLLLFFICLFVYWCLRSISYFVTQSSQIVEALIGKIAVARNIS